MRKVLLVVGIALIIASGAWAFPGRLLVGGGQPVAPPPPGTIACALGQPYTGTVPAGAAAAGFNTCAFHIDMSQPYYQTLSNWLDCSFNGGAAAVTPLMWFVGGQNGSSITCSNLSVVSDNGTPALLFNIPAGTPNGTGNGMITENPNVQVGQLFPQTMYIEFSSRMDASSNTACNNPYCLTGAFFEYRINPEPGAPYRWTEWDWMEFYPGLNSAGHRPTAASVGHSGTSLGNFNGSSYDPLGGDPGFPAHGTADNTVKQNFASRVVADGAGNMSWCSYLNGTLTPSCFFGSYTNGAGYNDNFNFREHFVITNQTLPTGNTVQTGDMKFYIYNVTIWECSGWNTGTSVIPGRGPLAELGNNCLNSTAAVTGALTGAP